MSEKQFPNEWKWQQFPNIGYIQTVLNYEQMAPIINELSEIKADFFNATKFNYNLAGNLNKEFELTKCFDYLDLLISPLGDEYIKCFDYSLPKKFTSNKNFRLTLDKVWANFQSKHEVNPVHTHHGVLSFVLYVSIPFSLEDEKRILHGPPEYEKRSGNFTFLYTDALGTIRAHNLEIDSTWESTLIIFPATMSHMVYPFYSSNDFRITVAGNLKIKD